MRWPDGPQDCCRNAFTQGVPCCFTWKDQLTVFPLPALLPMLRARKCCTGEQAPRLDLPCPGNLYVFNSEQ